MKSSDAVDRLLARRRFIMRASAGASLAALGLQAVFADEGLIRSARAAKRPDGRPRLPPGQRVISALKPMGGEPGDASRAKWKLRVHGEVDAPYELDFRALLAMTQVEQKLDVHCVTGWSMFDARFEGVRIADLAKRAKLRKTARHVIFESAHGYTANVPLDEALGPRNMLAHRHEGRALAHTHGGPVRGVVPDLYFWKSAKWITGIRFVARDDPGYWETRGYHNHADPWREQRYSYGRR